ncbi:unnamed protein product [Spirodela intermedia]|uniref:Uncharacterized protein n=1 Tax=Spirodela intermedia TaxID=51605 RepID=A0A7I8JP74_SPIIN|nr:unnamed protein product [Spirodela intermedia]CAA6671997.1 unnamed protein product [Spirodela intermedia]
MRSSSRLNLKPIRTCAVRKREIPGFYFNVEKNRYFPIKDPIPGRIRRLAHTVAVEEATSSSSSSHSPSSSREHGKAKKRTRVSDLLQFRELYGRLLMFSETDASLSKNVWKYKNTDLLSDSALEQFNAPIQTPEGQKETDVLLMGSKGDLGGSVYFLNFNEALDFSSNVLGHHRISKISSYDFTIWTSASNSSGTKAALGTNQGAALLNLETGRLSWLYRTKSDIFSQRFDQSGNVVLCGLRNGSILVVDVRQKPSGSRRHFTSSTRDPVESTAEGANMHQRKHHRNWITRRHQVEVHYIICFLVPLHSDEQYFFGSSMDGSIELFDQRLLHRGPVQSYEGHANSHSHLELGVDPSEAFVLSGGEDCYLRIWSIKSGKMLFAENVSDSVLKTVCWMVPEAVCSWAACRRGLPWLRPKNGGAWLGSREGLFYLNRA